MTDTKGPDTVGDAERARLASAPAGRPGQWKALGPYLRERAWGSVREDYSADGNAWAFFPLSCTTPRP